MSLTVVKGLQSEIYVPRITPPAVCSNKRIKDMSIALALHVSHKKSQERFNLAGDFTWRKIENTTPSSELMVSHGGYDNGDVNKDINCMFPIDKSMNLQKKDLSEHVLQYTQDSWAVEIRRNSNMKLVRPSHRCLKKRMSTQSSSQLDEVPATALQILVQRAIEEAGIPTIIIAALPPVVRQTGTPRAVAPLTNGSKCRRTEQRRNADRL